MEKMPLQHLNTISTVSSSTGSGKHRLHQTSNSSPFQSRGIAFNTHTMLESLAEESPINLQKPWFQTDCFQDNTGGLSGQPAALPWKATSQVIPTISKREKLSLRRGRTGHHNTQLMDRKESLNYEQLLTPLTLETVRPRNSSTSYKSNEPFSSRSIESF